MNRDRWWKWQQRMAPYALLAPATALFAVFLAWPLVRSLMLSFCRTVGPRHQTFVGLANYRQLLAHDPPFLLAMANTTGFTLAFLALNTPIALLLAIALNSRRVRGRSLLRFGFFSTYIVGPVFVGVIFAQLFAATGPVNRALGSNIPWLSSANLAMPTVLIASLWLSCGYSMIYFLAALQAIDHRLYEAAQVDGAGAWSAFLHVTLPSIRPALAFVVLVGTVAGFQLFELPYVLLQGPGPGLRGLTIVMYLFSAGFNTGDLGYASAIGWTLVVILLAISLVQWRLFHPREPHA